MTEKRIVSGDEILKAEDTRYVEVDISPWLGSGAYIRLKSLQAEEAFTFIENIGKNEGMIQIVVKSAVDEEGNRILTDDKAEALKKKSFGMFARIQEAAMELNGLRKRDNFGTRIKND